MTSIWSIILIIICSRLFFTLIIYFLLCLFCSYFLFLHLFFWAIKYFRNWFLFFYLFLWLFILSISLLFLSSFLSKYLSINILSFTWIKNIIKNSRLHLKSLYLIQNGFLVNKKKDQNNSTFDILWLVHITKE